MHLTIFRGLQKIILSKLIFIKISESVMPHQTLFQHQLGYVQHLTWKRSGVTDMGEGPAASPGKLNVKTGFLLADILIFSILFRAIPTVASGPPSAKFFPRGMIKSSSHQTWQMSPLFWNLSKYKTQKKGRGTWYIISPPSEKSGETPSPCPPPKFAHGCRRSQGAKHP